MTAFNDESSVIASESTLPLDGGGVHVYQDGPRDAPTLLLIHGTGASARSWEPMVPLLAESHHVIRIDLPGCGLSAEPEDGNYAVPSMARQVGAALEELGVAHVIPVGHSSGGSVATALAEERPDLVDALAFINTGPDMAAYIAKELALRAESWSELTDEQIRQAMSDGFRPGFEIPKWFVDQFRDIDFHVFAAISQALRAYLGERSLPERLAPLGKPLLVLFGEQDQRWRPASAADYHAVPGATVIMLPDAGHSPNLEDPPRTATHLLPFAANHTAPRGEDSLR